MENQFAAVVFGLSSALVWGAGDFCGGLATRRASVWTVLLLAETAGLVVLIFAAWVTREGPVVDLPSIGWAVAAGMAGTAGLGALYRGLAVGRASIVAPVSSVVGAGLPALLSAAVEGLPDGFTLLGFGFAFAAIALAGQSHQSAGQNHGFGLGVLAGIGFGLFFIFIDQSGSHATFFPLAIARGASIPLLLAVFWRRGLTAPPRAALPIVLLSGTCDAGGNIFFLLSSQSGRLDIATILSSLYPASTVILSRMILGERTTRLQQAGVVAALLAVMLIAV